MKSIKNAVTSITAALLITGMALSFNACSQDVTMAPENQSTTLDETGTGFSRYAIGLDSWGTGDDVYYGMEEDTTNYFMDPGEFIKDIELH